MFWFGKKNKKDIETSIDSIQTDNEEIATEVTETENNLDVSGDASAENVGVNNPDCDETEVSGETGTEEEGAEDAIEFEDDGDDNITDDLTDNIPDDGEKVTKIMTSVEDMIDFINSKGIGRVQYMRKSDMEAFEIGDSHLRLAEIWGSVSMSREYKPSEYAKIMLAGEVMENPEEFYILPSLSEEETHKSISDFCEEHYGLNGKKYVKDRNKFAKLVRESGKEEEWLEYNRTLTAAKVLEFCEKNKIEFKSEENVTGDDE